MTATVTLRIAEVRVEADPARVDLALLERALTAALTRLGHQLRDAVGDDARLPAHLELAPMRITAAMADASQVDDALARLADRILAAVRAQMEAAR